MHTNKRLTSLLAVSACSLLALGTTAATAATSRPVGVAKVQQAGHHPEKSKHPRHDRDRLMPVQLLSFNDFHGNLEPPTGSSGTNVVGQTIDPKTGLPVNVTQ